MVKTVTVGQNETIDTADYCNTDEIELGLSTIVDDSVKTDCSKTNKQAEAAAQGQFFDPAFGAVAEVGQTIEIDGSPSSGQQLKVGFDGSYDAYSALVGAASDSIEIISYIADEQVNNPYDRHFYVNTKGAFFDARPITGNMSQTSNELYLDFDQMSDGDRFVVGVAVRLSVSALGRALSTADVHTAENSGPFKFDGQVSYNQIRLTWT